MISRAFRFLLRSVSAGFRAIGRLGRTLSSALFRLFVGALVVLVPLALVLGLGFLLVYMFLVALDGLW